MIFIYILQSLILIKKHFNHKLVLDKQVILICEKQNLMLNKIILLLTILPIFCFGQWNQLGGTANGIASNDKLGDFNAIAIDAIGNTIAVGSSRNSDMGQYFGYAKVLDWNGTAWVQRGATFLGNANYEGTGSAVDLTADGNTVVVSSPWGFNGLGYKSGLVNVYDWNGTAWILRGATIEGEGNPDPLLDGDIFGRAVAISPDGNYLAVGAPSNTQAGGVLQIQGHARVYHWDGQSWVQMGLDIDGEVSLEEFGLTIDISADGSKLSVGGRSFTLWSGGSPVSQDIGIVRNYAWDGTQWNLRGTPMMGAAQGDKFGASVSLSDDGNTLAISSTKTNGSNSSTQLFEWANNQWISKGSSVIGINNAAGGPCNDLSADGNMLAIGESWSNSVSGGAKIYEWNGTQWTQVNNSLQSSNSSINAFGTSVRLSDNGSTVVVSAPSQDVNSLNSAGSVYTFQNPTLVSVKHLNQSNQLTVYPNPTDNHIHIETTSDIQEISLYSVLGQEVWTRKGSGRELDLDLSRQASGSYWLVLQTDDKVATVQITKQ